MKTNLDTLTENVLIYLASFNTVYNCPRGRRLKYHHSHYGKWKLSLNYAAAYRN